MAYQQWSTFNKSALSALDKCTDSAGRLEIFTSKFLFMRKNKAEGGHGVIRRPVCVTMTPPILVIWLDYKRLCAEERVAGAVDSEARSQCLQRMAAKLRRPAGGWILLIHVAAEGLEGNGDCPHSERHWGSVHTHIFHLFLSLKGLHCWHLIVCICTVTYCVDKIK